MFVLNVITQPLKPIMWSYEILTRFWNNRPRNTRRYHWTDISERWRHRRTCDWSTTTDWSRSTRWCHYGSLFKTRITQSWRTRCIAHIARVANACLQSVYQLLNCHGSYSAPLFQCCFNSRLHNRRHFLVQFINRIDQSLHTHRILNWRT